MDSKEILSIVIGLCGLLGMLIAFWEKIFNSGKKSADMIRRVDALEQTVSKTSKDIETIKENHLAHIQDDINKINVNLEGINTTLTFLREK